MALAKVVVTAKPVTTARAEVSLTDPSSGLPPGSDSLPSVTANDGEKVVQLTRKPNGTLVAHPVATGGALVSLSSTEYGVAQVGTATVTVTTVSGKLQAAWSSGTQTVH